MKQQYRVKVWARNLNEWVELPGVYSSEEDVGAYIKKSKHRSLSYDLSRGLELEPIVDFSINPKMESRQHKDEIIR